MNIYSEEPLSQDDEKTTPPDVIYLPAVDEVNEAARSGLVDNSVSIGADQESIEENGMTSDKPPTAGDPDAMLYQSEVVGEEAIGGTTPTPDQNNIDEIVEAVGLNTQAEHPVNVMGEMHKRDERRFELDPESQERGTST